MNRSTICVCLEPRDDWQLGSLTTDRGSVFLLSWYLIPTCVDDGDDMPEAVGSVLVRAMTSLASVTYLRSAEMKSLEDDLERLGKENLVRRLVGNWYTGRKMRFWQYFGGAPHPRDLVTTESSETAMELFDSPGYSWWGQGQVAFLSAPDSPPPAIDRRTLRSFSSDHWVEQAADLADRTGLFAVMYPGHDGAYVGIFSATASFQHELLEALEETATQAGFNWASLMTDEAFGDCLAGKRMR
ncbi:hypothetical protein [Candidatus Thiosymbion oneisti]|uniref:hypothetical protein n=1 Tax=Candidatus Thiosymbion oneisti TaxID=589554 RepID=UPI000B7DED08|nr:hypothetical protein [Candidatus Thiosymbion oneisti]